MKFDIDGQEVLCRRLQLGMSRVIAARKAGLTNMAIYNIETGKNKGAYETTITGLARALGCKPTDLAPDYVPPYEGVERVWYDPDRLKAARLEAGYSYRTLANESGVYHDTIRMLENPTKAPKTKPQTLLRLCEALDIDPSEISGALRVPSTTVETA